MKKLVAALMLSALATTTTAGTLVYTPEVAPVVIEESGPMGNGSGAWIIPLLLIGLLLLSTQSSEPNNGLNGQLNDFRSD